MKRRRRPDITRLLAIYGAVLSTIALGWNVYREVSRRGAIELTFFTNGSEPTPCWGLDGREDGGDERCYYQGRVTNVGNLAIVPAKVVLTLPGGKERTVRFDAHEITPASSSIRVACSVYSIPAIEAAYVLDSLGHRWSANAAELKKAVDAIATGREG